MLRVALAALAFTAAGQGYNVRKADEASRLAETGLEPIRAVARRGDQVMRASFQSGDSWGVPSISLIRAKGGRIFVRVSTRGGKIEGPVSETEWRKFETEVQALLKVERTKWKDDPNCSGWNEVFETTTPSGPARRDGHVCDPSFESQNTKALAWDLLHLASQAIPQCAPPTDQDVISDMEGVIRCAKEAESRHR